MMSVKTDNMGRVQLSVIAGEGNRFIAQPLRKEYQVLTVLWDITWVLSSLFLMILVF